MKAFRLATISDIHLGHRRTGAQFIIDNLNKHFSNDAFFASIDMVVFVGDVFDAGLYLFSDEAGHIDHWIARVLRLAKKHNVLVRVVEGTKSHDRGQPIRFSIVDAIHRASEVNDIDMKYVTTLSVEHIDRFDIDVLYIPDEWNTNAEKTLDEAKELIEAAGLTQVDFGFFHGFFPFQMPILANSPEAHNQAEYELLVKYLIYIGHIHTHSFNGKVYAQGSFDRIAHGEPNPKGLLRTVIEEDGTYHVTFVENTDAKSYLTVYTDYAEIEESIKLIDKAVKKLAAGSHVRIEAKRGNPILGSTEVLLRRWPLLNWTTKPQKVAGEVEHMAFVEEAVFIPVAIRPDNLRQLILSRLTGKGLSAEALQLCENQLIEMESL